MPTTFFDVGGEGVDGAGDDAEAGEGEDGAGLLAEVFGVAGAVEVGLELLDLVIELVGGDVLGEAGFLLLLQLAFRLQSDGEPIGDGFDDLADASLGDFVFFGEPPGGEVLDEVEAVDFEIARGRRQGGRGEHCGCSWWKKGFKFQVSGFKFGKLEFLAQECTQGYGLVWSIPVKRKKDFLK